MVDYRTRLSDSYVRTAGLLGFTRVRATGLRHHAEVQTIVEVPYTTRTARLRCSVYGTPKSQNAADSEKQENVVRTYSMITGASRVPVITGLRSSGESPPSGGGLQPFHVESSYESSSSWSSSSSALLSSRSRLEQRTEWSRQRQLPQQPPKCPGRRRHWGKGLRPARPAHAVQSSVQTCPRL